jgi:hypothetical protein
MAMKRSDSGEAYDLKCFQKVINQAGVSTATWTGKGGAKTVEDLYNEIQEGSCDLVYDRRKGLYRVVSIVALRIRSPSSEPKFLLETGCSGIGEGETIRWQVRLPAGRAEHGEMPREAAQRILWEYLQIEEDDLDFMQATDERETWTDVAKSFPGIRTRFQNELFDVHISEDEGLMERLRLRPVGLMEGLMERMSSLAKETVL